MSTTDLGDMNLSPEELEESDKGAGFNLIVPAKAEAGRKKGIARWTEFVTVEDAYREDAPGGLGQKRILFTLAVSVKGGAQTENADRKFNVFIRLNPGFMRGKAEDLGQGDPRKEATMHSMSMKKLKQIMVAIGLPLTQGLTAEVLNALFPTADESADGALLGKTLAFIMQDNKNKKTPAGENQQEPDAILAAPEGV